MTNATEVVDTSSRKGGRPKKLRAEDPRTLDELRGLGQIGCTVREASAFLKVSTTTFEAFLDETLPGEPDEQEPRLVRSVWDDGHALSRVSLRRSQFALEAKNAAMAIFLGKNLLGQSDRREDAVPDDPEVPLGKKAQATADAAAAIAEGGRYAPRAPPRLVASGGRAVED